MFDKVLAAHDATKIFLSEANAWRISEGIRGFSAIPSLTSSLSSFDKFSSTDFAVLGFSATLRRTSACSSLDSPKSTSGGVFGFSATLARIRKFSSAANFRSTIGAVCGLAAKTRRTWRASYSSGGCRTRAHAGFPPASSISITDASLCFRGGCSSQ